MPPCLPLDVRLPPVSRKYGYELFSRDEAAAAEYIIENTEPDALFLTRDNHDNTVATLTGRNIVCGSGSYLYFHGLNYQGQQRLAEQMLTNAEVFEANRKSEGLDYVYIGYHERALYRCYHRLSDGKLSHCVLCRSDHDL